VTDPFDLGRYGRSMEEARAVIERLARIEALEREGAAPTAMLAEVRELLREGEAWVATERDGTDLAADALAQCRAADDRGAQPVS
jgi:hypothetical protein